MSRPRKTEATKRIHPVTFWLTTAEFDQLQTVAQRAGLRVNDLARRLTCRGHTRLVIQVTRRHDPAFISQIHRIGLNLNTLCKNAFIFGRVSPKVAEVCDEIRRVVLAAAEAEARDDR